MSTKNELKHVAVIMDGNGRWAKERGLTRLEGHAAGVEALRNLVREIGQFGVKTLTVFAFSSENWTRPEAEIAALMGLIKDFIRSDLEELKEAGVRIRVIGARNNVPNDVLELIDHAQAHTATNDSFELVVAFNYGGRDEIVRAARQMAERVAQGEISAQDITETSFSATLDTNGIIDPELIIRTSGEMRLSNFLLWQTAYSEMVFVDCYWPEFDKQAFEKALAEYQCRERRFGGLAEEN